MRLLEEIPREPYAEIVLVGAGASVPDDAGY
jgi:hypothetical protein